MADVAGLSFMSTSVWSKGGDWHQDRVGLESSMVVSSFATQQ